MLRLNREEAAKQADLDWLLWAHSNAILDSAYKLYIKMPREVSTEPTKKLLVKLPLSEYKGP